MNGCTYIAEHRLAKQEQPFNSKKMKHSTVHMIWLLLLSMVVISCKDDDGSVNPNDPSGLNFIVTVSDENPGEVTIVSSAKNTVEYALFIGNDEAEVDKNETGVFNYTFNESGTYKIQVRAYGSSGRYVKKEKTITIDVGSDAVSLEDGYSTPLIYEEYDLIWHDEFDQSSINKNYWTFEIGDGCPNLCGWGNNELEYYREENAWTEDDVLVIEAREESFGGKSYTSARMKTQGKQSFTYGRIDIRALLPKGQGIWPALWMLGENITSVGWPACGEIDIMEMIGGTGNDNSIHGTVHYDKNGTYVYHGGHKTLASGIFADQYHVFSIIWDETSINWYVDDEIYYSVDITPEYMSEFHNKFFFIFNIAVGGNWPGSPDESTSFPQQMKVDYVRVFKSN
jgi:beta-glucanase (GH16 family)